MRIKNLMGAKFSIKLHFILPVISNEFYKILYVFSLSIPKIKTIFAPP